MSIIKLVAIVNSFNRLSLLQLGFPSLVAALKSYPFSSAVVVFEAGSNDGSQDWLRQFCQQNVDIVIEVVYPSPGQDTSFSTGVNVACEYAVTKYPDLEWYFLFETDNWIANVEPILLATQLLKDQEKLAAAGFTVLKHSGHPTGYGCSFPTIWQFLIGQQLTYLLQLENPKHKEWKWFQNTRWTTCDVVYTSPLLVKRTAWEQTQGLDATVFPFSDCDIDWSWRLHKLGWQTAVLDVQGVVHDNKQELSSWSSTRVIHFHRARFQLLLRHVGKWVKWLKPVLLVRHSLEFLILLLLLFRLKYPKNSLKKRLILLKSVFNDYEIDKA